MKKIFFAAMAGIMILSGAARSWAGAGVSGAQILQQLTSAGSAGMGGAYTACSGSIYAMGSNPAGLSGLKTVEIMFMHVGGFEGLSTEMLAGALPIPGLGTLGVEALYSGQPPIDNDVPGEAALEVMDLVFGISFARPIISNLSLGINAKVASMTLGPADASVFSMDIGTQYQISKGVQLGLAARHLGTPAKFIMEEDPLPLTMVLGASFIPLDKAPHRLISAVDIEYIEPEENTVVRLGGEYRFQHMLALRMGYVYSVRQIVGGISLGIGFKFKAGKVNLVLDYTLLPEFWEAADFASQNLVSLGVTF
ncbi:PorV/PorQ family protein [bacterium]|nr:PorV/PorQ family protein [bacterium]